EINQGNLGARAQVKSSDEIGRLSLTFNTMADSIKDHTENLEEKVQQRTHELNQAFEEVNKLKTQQDGDYFLTSLLIKPLLINRVKSQKSRVEFFLKQKKDFIFRNRHSEIGGDVNIAHSITLRGKPYLIFVNGDAMGKSLQGAGGALVMGAVFNSMISRNSLLSQSQDMAPEIWLSECYQELQQIFEAFDGSMMISAIVGLFDENAGLMYYFNAEHPWPVLYRDGHAEFMEEETSLRKLGTVGFSEPLVIRTFQLQGGDAVIMGSDGKDDLLIGVDENSGLKIVNENERLFLNQVEKGEGDLLKIVEQLKILGELTDDLSLLKLSYGAEQESLDPENEQIKRRGAQFFSEQKYQLALEEFRKVLASQKDRDCYQQAALCLKNLGEKGQLALLLEESAKAFPADRNLLYQTSLAFKKEKSYEKALEYGLRVFLTEPGHLNNLINLSDLYRLSGQVVEAKKISAQAALLDPDNKHLARLIKMLE
ncbi:MAG: stage II sporulation protein E, partial [Spirochaetae bacterium HGW-Spirochaetae-6]